MRFQKINRIEIDRFEVTVHQAEREFFCPIENKMFNIGFNGRSVMREAMNHAQVQHPSPDKAVAWKWCTMLGWHDGRNNLMKLVRTKNKENYGLCDSCKSKSKAVNPDQPLEANM